MRDLNWDLLQLQRRAGDDGSHATRRDRSYALAQMANTLHEAGYRGLRAKGLKGKHIEAPVRDWSDPGLSDATMMNRMAHLRWWADQVGKANMVKTNADYGIRPRSHVSDGTNRRELVDGGGIDGVLALLLALYVAVLAAPLAEEVAFLPFPVCAAPAAALFDEMSTPPPATGGSPSQAQCTRFGELPGVLRFRVATRSASVPERAARARRALTSRQRGRSATENRPVDRASTRDTLTGIRRTRGVWIDAAEADRDHAVDAHAGLTDV